MKHVSLYIPCYNVERYLKYCLDGIFLQTSRPDEVIVVDDGSTDNTVEIAEQYDVKIVRHKGNKGLSVARNTGLMHSSHEYVASLDADCVPNPDWLEQLMTVMSSDEFAGVGGRLVERNTSRLPDRWRAYHMIQHWGDRPIKNPLFIFGNNNVWRKSVLLKAGKYDERLATNFEDVSMSEKVTANGHSLAYQPSAVVEHLRTDTMQSVMRAFWKWHFYGYREDITLRNVSRQIRRHLTTELAWLLANDARKRDPLCALLSCAVITNAVYSDIKHFREHRGECAVHTIQESVRESEI